MRDEQPRIRRSKESDRQGLNVALVAISAACGIGYLVSPQKMPGLAAASGIFYGLQFLESFTSGTWGYLNNIRTRDDAIADLQEAVRKQPQLSYTIENFHYEEVEVKRAESQSAVKKVQNEYEKEQAKLEKALEEINAKIEELKKGYFKAS